jgi:hypothetical protein
MSIERPIEDMDRIDIVGERHDGGLDAVIVASGPLDKSTSTIEALRQKVQNYVFEMTNSHFRTRYNISERAILRVLVSCQFQISDRARVEIERLRPWALAAGVVLQIDE